MMGSLRNPAGWNGIYSHRPTAGMVPTESFSEASNPLPYPISTPGPMARSPMDCALMLDTMVGTSSIAERLRIGDTSKLRVAWLGDWGGKLPVEKDILSTCHSCLMEMQKRGLIELEDYSKKEVFPLSLLWTNWNRVRYSTTVSLMRLMGRDLDYILENVPVKSDLKWEINQGLKVTREELEEAAMVQEEFASTMESIGEDIVWALPSAQNWPFPANWTWPERVAGTEMDTYHRWMEIMVPVSFGGYPCTTIPVTSGFRPIGIQLFAKRGQDSMLMQLAKEYDKAFDPLALVTRTKCGTPLLNLGQRQT